MAVSLSAGQLRPGIVETVAEALGDSDLDARCLTLEITESLLMDESAESLGYLTELKALGVRETFEQLRFLLGRGCDAVQGYLVGRPVPASTMRRLLADPGSDLGVGGSLEVLDEPVPAGLDAKLADLLAGATAADGECEPLVQSLLVRLEQATPSESR